MNKTFVRILGIFAILALLLSALAPVFYAFAPKYEYVPPEEISDNIEVPVEVNNN